MSREGQKHLKLLRKTPLLMDMVLHSKPGLGKRAVAHKFLWQHTAQCQAACQQMSPLQPSKQLSSLLVWRACNRPFQQQNLGQAARLPIRQLQRMLWIR